MKKRAVSEQTLGIVVDLLLNSSVNATTAQVMRIIDEIKASEQVPDEPKEMRAEMRVVKPEPKQPIQPE